MAVHDGDTCTLHVDLGFNTWHEGPFRLVRCNAREIAELGGVEAKDNLSKLIYEQDLPVTLRSIKPNTPIQPDKYGERYLAEIILPDGRNLTDWLIAQQWAAAWNGRGTKPLPPWPRTVG